MTANFPRMTVKQRDKYFRRFGWRELLVDGVPMPSVFYFDTRRGVVKTYDVFGTPAKTAKSNILAPGTYHPDWIGMIFEIRERQLFEGVVHPLYKQSPGLQITPAGLAFLEFRGKITFGPATPYHSGFGKYVEAIVRLRKRAVRDRYKDKDSCNLNGYVRRLIDAMREIGRENRLASE